MDVYELEKHKIIIEHMSLKRAKAWECYQTICKIATSGKLGTVHMRVRLVFQIMRLFFYSILTPVLLILASGGMMALEYFADSHALLYGSYSSINRPAIFTLFGFIVYCACSVAAWCVVACGFVLVAIRSMTVWLCIGVMIGIMIVTFGMMTFFDLSYSALCKLPLQLWRFCIMQHTAITAVCYWVFYHKQLICIFKLTQSTADEFGNHKFVSPTLFDRVVVARALGNYVGLTLSNGTQIEIRQSFSEVIKRLKGRGGIQVHRSYWVKGDEMLSIKKIKHRFFATTRFGEVPISRNYLERVSVLCGSRK